MSPKRASQDHLASMAQVHVLRYQPSIDDKEWIFTGVPTSLLSPPPSRSNRPRAKLIIFKPDKITLQAAELASNRVVHHEDPAKIALASFDQFRFPDTKPSISSEYIFRLLKAGLFLNGTQYRFFGHGNSQLVRRRLSSDWRIHSSNFTV